MFTVMHVPTAYLPLETQFAAKLKRSIKQHPLREMHIEQVRSCPAV